MPRVPVSRIIDDMSEITATMADALRRTKPWVWFISVAVFVASVLLAILGVRFLAGPMRSMRLGVIGLVLALVYAGAAVHLFRFAHSIRDAMTAADVENPLRRQKSFWRFIGIVGAIAIPANLLLFIVGRVLPR